jgi:hypothetical protein
VFSFAQASQKNPFVDNSGVCIPYRDANTFADKQESSDMSDQFYKDQTEKLEAQVDNLTSQLDTLREEHTKAGIDNLKSQIANLAGEVTTLTEERDGLTVAKTELETAKAELETKIDETIKARDEYKVKVEEAEAAAIKASRIAELVESGAEKEEAETKVEAFISLNDEQWAVIASTLKEAFTVKKNQDSENDEDDSADAGDSDDEDPSKSDAEDDSAADNADADLEDTDTDDTEPVMAVAGEAEDELKAVRKELRAAVANRLGKTLSEDENDSE